ncbi:MAG: hypothetical protein ACXVKH_00730 [Candidatus Angelobacter sp.]
MKEVRFPLTVLVLLVIGTLSACRHHHEEHPPSTPQNATLKIILNGPVAIVVKKNDPSRIIAFTPRDPQNIHEFYFNDLEHSQDKQKNYHINLMSDGLKAASTSPSIDPYLVDFTTETDLWKREEYFVTIDLPVPNKITFAPPLHPVHFENGTAGYMATNFVLEYKVAEHGKVHAVSRELGAMHPLASSALQEQYAKLCGGAGVGKRFHDSCIEIRNLLAQCAGPQTSVFFFGVGMRLVEQSQMSAAEEDDHAVHFFNEVLLRSFPHLTSKRLAPAGTPGREGTGGPRGMLMQASLKLPVSRMRALPVSAVIDCKAGGLIVTTTQ